MVSSLGLNAAASCAAVRAHTRRFRELKFHDRRGQPIIGAAVPEATEHFHGRERLAPMLARAVAECLARLPESANGQVPLFLGLAGDDRPDVPPDTGAYVLTTVARRLGLRLHPVSAAFMGGWTAFFRVLARAREFVRHAPNVGCIVAAADSLLNSGALAWLEAHGQLKTGYNPDGVIPGEAAAAVWVTNGGHSRVSAPLRVLGFGFGEEPSARSSDAPNLAVGLAAALRAALADAGVELSQVAYRIVGLTGERETFMEASTALARVQRAHREKFLLWSPSEHLGDVGAALPACSLVIAAAAAARGYAPGERALIYAPSRGIERAACVVEDGRVGHR